MFRLLLVAALAAAACRKSAPAPAPAAEPVPAPAVAAAPVAADIPAPTEAPAVGEDEDPSLDGYVAFSDDGHAFAVAETSPGAGVAVLTFHAVPSGTVEKRLLLDSAEARRKALEELLADGFPRAAARRLPPGLAAAVRDNKIQVAVAGRPAAAPFAPFARARPTKTEPLAVSKDGRVVAVRTEGTDDAGEFGPEAALHFVRLFE